MSRCVGFIVGFNWVLLLIVFFFLQQTIDFIRWKCFPLWIFIISVLYSCAFDGKRICWFLSRSLSVVHPGLLCWTVNGPSAVLSRNERQRKREGKDALWYIPFAYFCRWNCKGSKLESVAHNSVPFAFYERGRRGGVSFFFFNAASSLGSLRHLNLNEVANCLPLLALIWIGFAWFLNVTWGI